MTVLLDERTQALLLPQFLAPEIADAFVRTMWKDFAGGQVLVRPHSGGLVRKNAIESKGNGYAPLMALHWGLTPAVTQLIGKYLLPSFAYFRIYFSDDICRVHSDRPACEYSLSLTLALSDSVPWDLSMGTQQAESTATTDDFGDEPYESYPLSAGDALLYRGTARRHGRLTPNPNRWSAHAFFEWVERDGSHHCEAFEDVKLGPSPTF
jgi:hypothetical protein